MFTPNSTSIEPPEKRSNGKSRWRSYLVADIRDDTFLEAELLLLAFATAIQDATTFPDYHCFASNQTGNTVLLAVGVAGIGKPIFELQNIGISLAMFVVGGWIMGQIGNHFGPRRRWWLLTSSTIQTAMVFAASVLQYRYGVLDDGNSSVTLGIIALLAFSSGGQVAMIRSMGITDITTAMATAAYVDILIDQKILEVHNRPRNRRILFLVSLVAGSFAGAYTYAGVNSAFALLLSAMVKSLATVALLFNTEIKNVILDSEEGGRLCRSSLVSRSRVKHVSAARQSE